VGGGGHGLFEGPVQAFSWRNWGRSWKMQSEWPVIQLSYKLVPPKWKFRALPFGSSRVADLKWSAWIIIS